jgi:hypothetical protein
MSVKVLLCEGEQNGPEQRILQMILAGSKVLIQSEGSKFGLDRRVLSLRDVRRESKISAIRDRDFDFLEDQQLGQAHPWSVERRKEINRIGWYWERREIENYLIDPIVIANTLNDKVDLATYQSELAQEAKNRVYYTAAQIALTLTRQQPENFPNAWSDYPYSTADECREGIRQIIKNYVNNRKNQIDEQKALNQFEEYLPLCSEGGFYYTNYLIFFSGKVLKAKIERKFQQFGLRSISGFEKLILKRMEGSSEVWKWLPEWEDLRTQILNYS